jgi:hypothetical protein
MLLVPLCGLRVLREPESIGIHSLSDLRGRDPWRLAVQALQNVADAAAQTGTRIHAG